MDQPTTKDCLSPATEWVNQTLAHSSYHAISLASIPTTGAESDLTTIPDLSVCGLPALLEYLSAMSRRLSSLGLPEWRTLMGLALCHEKLSLANPLHLDRLPALLTLLTYAIPPVE